MNLVPFCLVITVFLSTLSCGYNTYSRGQAFSMLSAVEQRRVGRVKCRHSSLWWSDDTDCSTVVLLFQLPPRKCTLIISSTHGPWDLAQLNVTSCKPSSCSLKDICGLDFSGTLSLFFHMHSKTFMTLIHVLAWLNQATVCNRVQLKSLIYTGFLGANSPVICHLDDCTRLWQSTDSVEFQRRLICPSRTQILCNI